MVHLTLRFIVLASAALSVSAHVLPRRPAGTQFITGPCKSDTDCASDCCGFNTGKCAGAVIAQERDGGCGFGDAKPNNRAAQKIQGPNAEAAPGVPKTSGANVAKKGADKKEGGTQVKKPKAKATAAKAEEAKETGAAEPKESATAKKKPAKKPTTADKKKPTAKKPKKTKTTSASATSTATDGDTTQGVAPPPPSSGTGDSVTAVNTSAPGGADSSGPIVTQTSDSDVPIPSPTESGDSAAPAKPTKIKTKGGKKPKKTDAAKKGKGKAAAGGAKNKATAGDAAPKTKSRAAAKADTKKGATVKKTG